METATPSGIVVPATNNRKTLSIVLGVVGAALIVVALFVPFASFLGTHFKILNTANFNRNTFQNVIEPLGVAGLVLLTLFLPLKTDARRGALFAFGAATVLFFISYALIGGVSTGVSFEATSLVGIAAGGLLIVSGFFAGQTSATGQPQALAPMVAPTGMAAPPAAEPAPPSDTKVCPQCAEPVKAAAQVCRFCGHSFATDS